MKTETSQIEGVKVIHSEPFKDERGFFNRIFCCEELRTIHPDIAIAQINHSMTARKGTVRGMHFQQPPHAEIKIVRCLRGSIFDVAVDLRKNSPTFLQWHGEILSADNMKALVVPEGCAHGFQSLEDAVEMLYIHSKPYCKFAESSIRYDDPMIGIQWQLQIAQVSEKDKLTPLLTDKYGGIEI
jgi:dTDP-4-dehydrorhamnose 3,5-epimerase